MKKLRLIGLLSIPFLVLAGCRIKKPITSADQIACEEKLETTINELDVCLQKKIINTETVETTGTNPSINTRSNTTDNNNISGNNNNDTSIPNEISLDEQLARHTMFPPQPKYAVGNYSGNTAQLNAYAHNNMVTVQVPTSYTKMVVELLKPVADSNRNLIIYIKGNKRHCGARVLSGIPKGEQTFTFDLANMDVQGTLCDGDRRTKLGTIKTVRVWGFISEYNGNQINAIYFK